MDILYQILSYSIGSLFIGVILTVAGVVLMFYLIKSWYRNSTFTPVSFIAGGLLTLLLSFQMVLMCGAITIKSYCGNVEERIDMMVREVPANVRFTNGDSQQILKNVISEWPLVGYFIGGAEFAGHTSADIAHEMADELRSYMNWFILRRILWSFLFVVLGAAIVIKSMDIARGSRRGSHHSRRKVYDD